jgi:hypothetical protein
MEELLRELIPRLWKGLDRRYTISDLRGPKRRLRLGGASLSEGRAGRKQYRRGNAFPRRTVASTANRFGCCPGSLNVFGAVPGRDLARKIGAPAGRDRAGALGGRRFGHWLAVKLPGRLVGFGHDTDGGLG